MASIKTRAGTQHERIVKDLMKIMNPVVKDLRGKQYHIKSAQVRRLEEKERVKKAGSKR